MEAAGDACALQWLGLAVQLPHFHQTGHLILGDFNGLATPVGQADVSWGARGETRERQSGCFCHLLSINLILQPVYN